MIATDKGLCCITLPNETFDGLERWVTKYAPEAALLRNRISLSPYIEQIEEHLSGRRKTFAVLLDLRGTPFQVEVWRALLEIPCGDAKARSYTQIGESIRNPSAIRAVGTAYGANPIPIVIPCHRVIGKSGISLDILVVWTCSQSCFD